MLANSLPISQLSHLFFAAVSSTAVFTPSQNTTLWLQPATHSAFPVGINKVGTQQTSAFKH